MDMIESQANRKPRHLHKQWIAAAVVLGLLGLSAAGAEFYPVRELAAALIIFSVLFGTIGTALLSLLLIQQAATKAVACMEARLAHRHSDLVLGRPRWN